MSVRSFKFILVCLLSSLSYSSYADIISYEDKNLYKALYEDFLIVTENCDKEAYYDDATISATEISFSNNESCKIEAIYTKSNKLYKKKLVSLTKHNNEYLKATYYVEKDKKSYLLNLLIKSFDCDFYNVKNAHLNEHKLTINRNKNCRVTAIYESDIVRLINVPLNIN